MKKIAYYNYLLLIGLIQNISIHSMSVLQVTNSHNTTTDINPEPHTRHSFTRQFLRNDLEKEINDMKIKDKVTIKASGENVAIALDYACKNPDKIQKLELANPNISIAGLNPFEYYWGNFPLSSLDISRLKNISVSLDNDSTLDYSNVKALIQLCKKGRVTKISIPRYLTEWTQKLYTSHPNTELDTIITQEIKIWWYNKILLCTISILLLSVFYHKFMENNLQI